VRSQRGGDKGKRELIIEGEESKRELIIKRERERE